MADKFAPTEWICAIADSRDRDAFVALFKAFAPKLKSYFMRKGLPETLAEDLTQDTLLAVWWRAEQFDPRRADAASWIFGIARNRWIDAHRKEKHPSELVGALPPQRDPSPEQRLTLRHAGRFLGRALEALPAPDVMVLRAAFTEGDAHPEIARRLGWPLGTVKSRIRRAVARLRVVLQSDND